MIRHSTTGFAGWGKMPRGLGDDQSSGPVIEPPVIDVGVPYNTPPAVAGNPIPGTACGFSSDPLGCLLGQQPVTATTPAPAGSAASGTSWFSGTTLGVNNGILAAVALGILVLVPMLGAHQKVEVY